MTDLIYSLPGEHFEILHDSIDVLLDEGREPARDFSRARTAGMKIRSIEAHLLTAETKTIRALAMP